MQTRKFNFSKHPANAAFTLIELLVVIAIIGILAAMIAGLAGPAATKRKIARVTAELAQLETAIDSYKEKKGFYPPSNGDTNNAVTNQLFYELSGTKYDAANDQFITIKGDETIKRSELSIFGVEGFANSTTDPSDPAKNFIPGLRATQTEELSSKPDVELLVVPVEGPNDITAQSGKKLNPWRYNSKAPVHNPDSYDLWAEIVVGGKTNIIGNWKD